MTDATSTRKRLHFGVMFATLDNADQYEIWRGVETWANENDIHLTAYVGLYDESNNKIISFMDTCFETAANSRFLDGIILFSGSIAYNIGVEKFESYAKKIPKNMPMVSISFAMDGVPSVTAENFGGIFSAAEHLIRSHGKTKIAFIKGPDGHPEADERFDGYRTALTDNNIDFNPDYVLQGDFSDRSGARAVAELIENRNVSFDAIIAANDQMAMGAINELKSRNILVPTNVAVAAFDDDAASAFFMPSLSTTRQDFFKIGQTGAEMLSNIIAGKKVDKIKYVVPQFVTRQSCGCMEKELLAFEGIPAEKSSLQDFMQKSFDSVFENRPQEQINEWVLQLTNAIKENPFSRKNFLFFFNELLVKYNHFYDDLYKWHDALSALTTGVELHSDEVENTHEILAALMPASAFVHDILFKEEKNKELNLENVRDYIRRLSAALVLTFDLDALVEKLYESLPGLSMSTALIGVYHTPIKTGDPTADRTISTLIGFDGERKFNLTHNSWNPFLFSDYSTFDGFNLGRERRALFFLPLFFEDEEIGTMLLPYRPEIPKDAYENLRISVSTALKGSELLSKIQTLSITDELTGLLNRRGFFQFVYSRMRHLRRSIGMLPVVMFMDMDGLKAINDTFGHKAGDEAIYAFAKVLQESLREEDIIGRMGGDEFAVFTSVKSVENGELVVQRIRDKIDDYNNKNLHPFKISGSIGSVLLDDHSKECFEAAMLDADNILYAEKMEKKKKGISRQ